MKLIALAITALVLAGFAGAIRAGDAAAAFPQCNYHYDSASGKFIVGIYVNGVLRAEYIAPRAPEGCTLVGG